MQDAGLSRWVQGGMDAIPGVRQGVLEAMQNADASVGASAGTGGGAEWKNGKDGRWKRNAGRRKHEAGGRRRGRGRESKISVRMAERSASGCLAGPVLCLGL